MSMYLLDTHVLLWWLTEPEKLSAHTRQTIADADHTIYVSAAAGWEIGIKQALGRLRVPNHLPQSIEDQGIEVLAITFQHGLAVAQLPAHHQDPFDRMMIAQAIAENMVLVTRDPLIQKYDVAQLQA